MAASTRHVVTSAVLFDVLLALWTLFHPDAHNFFNVHFAWYGCTFLVWAPLVFTDETHNRVETQVAQAPTIWLRAIDLHGRWKEHILAQVAASCNEWLHDKSFYQVGLRLDVLLKCERDRFFAIRREATGDISMMNLAAVDLRARPACPATFACHVTTWSINEQRKFSITANDARGPRLSP